MNDSSGIVFVGDELSAAAWRLAGVATHVAEPQDTAAVLDRQAGTEVRLVLLGASHAAAMKMEDLMKRMARGDPPIMVVRGGADSAPRPDFVTHLRRRLGVAT